MFSQPNPSTFISSPESSKRRMKPSSSGFIPWSHKPLLILCLLIGVPFDAHAEAYIPAIGGMGGGQYKAPCPAGQNLMGFELRAGDDIDAIRPVCVIAYGSNKISAPPVTSAWSGGPGGAFAQLLCPAQTPVVIGLFVAAEGVDTIVVNNIHLYCGPASITQTKDIYPSSIFDAPGYTPSAAWLGLGVGGMYADRREGLQRCPDGQVAVGVHGRSGEMLDAMGLICDAPRIISTYVLGRVNIPPQTNTPTPPPIYVPQILGKVSKPSIVDKITLPPPSVTPHALGRVPVIQATPAAQTNQETQPAPAAQPAQAPQPTQPVPVAVPVPNTAPIIIEGLTPLTLYWNGQRGDNFVTATAKGVKSAKKASYKAVRNEACIFKIQQPGTVPLKLYWSKQREDFFTTATVEGIQSADQAAYKFVRNEGYVYPEPSPDNTRIPLKLYWSKARKDYYTTGTTEGAQNAEQTGYGLARIEGYALPVSQCQ